jgi:hypothetical protein
METPKFNIPKFNMPDLSKGFEPPKVNQETLDRINKDFEEQQRHAERRYKFEIGLVMVGLFIAGYGTYLTYKGNQTNEQREKQEERILTLEKETRDLRTILEGRNDELVRLQVRLDSIAINADGKVKTE